MKKICILICITVIIMSFSAVVFADDKVPELSYTSLSAPQPVIAPAEKEAVSGIAVMHDFLITCGFAGAVIFESIAAVDKYTPEITGNDYTLFVEGEQANAFSFKYTDNPTEHIEEVSISEVNDGSGKVISYDAKNNKIIAHNAGEATIYLSQPETETIKAGNSAKYPPKRPFSVQRHDSLSAGKGKVFLRRKGMRPQDRAWQPCISRDG